MLIVTRNKVKLLKTFLIIILCVGFSLQMTYAQNLNPKEIKLAENLLRGGNSEGALIIFKKHYKAGNRSGRVINGINKSLRDQNKFEEWIVFLKEVIVDRKSVV